MDPIACLGRALVLVACTIEGEKTGVPVAEVIDALQELERKLRFGPKASRRLDDALEAALAKTKPR